MILTSDNRSIVEDHGWSDDAQTHVSDHGPNETSASYMQYVKAIKITILIICKLISKAMLFYTLPTLPKLICKIWRLN